MNLTEWLPQQVFAFVVIFARFGGLLLVLPGIGEGFVPMRVRVAFAAALSLAFLGLIAVPNVPDSPLLTAVWLMRETVIGVFLGLVARFIVSALDTAGNLIGMQIGLANAMVLNPMMTQQGALTGVFLSMAGLVAIFASNLHVLFLGALVDSYTLFPAASAPPTDDMAYFLAQLLADSFRLATQLAAPLLVLGLVFNVGAGLLARLMPQVQIFFIITPLQIALGFLLMAATLTAVLRLFLETYENQLENFMGL
jgi:flagellar biosynthetic protein FliR